MTDQQKKTEEHEDTKKFHIAVGVAVLLCLILAWQFTSKGGRDKTVDGQSILATHKALYNMKLSKISSGMPLTDVSGDMFFEWGEQCDGWTTEHKFSLHYNYSDKPPVNVKSHYAAFESKNGDEFYFKSDTQRDGMPSEKIKGRIDSVAEGTKQAIYSFPEGVTFKLPEKFFLPSSHTVEFIKRAKAGEQFFNAILFDGTDAEGPVEVNAFIGKEVADFGYLEGLPEDVDRTLLNTRAWPVRLAFYNLKAQEEVPSYEMNIILHDNGVISKLDIDYQKFSVKQRLAALEPLEVKKCEE